MKKVIDIFDRASVDHFNRQTQLMRRRGGRKVRTPNGKWLGTVEQRCKRLGVDCPAGYENVEVYNNTRLKTRFGQCVWNGVAGGFKSWIEMNPKVIGTQHEKLVFLHELAHVIAGRRAGHGFEWKRVAHSLGIDGDRCMQDGVSEELGMRPAKPVVAVCECGYEMRKVRRPPIGSVYRHKGCKGKIVVRPANA